MENEYFINNNLKYLKYFLLAFTAFPIALLIGTISLHSANNDLIKIFSYISTVAVVLCVFIFLWLSTLPKYYFYIKNNILYLPISSFTKSFDEHVKFELDHIEKINIEYSADDGYDLLITVKHLNNNKLSNMNMALGHTSIKKEGVNLIICIHDLNIRVATKWENKLKEKSKGQPA